jgi:hypothetical protein
MFRRMQIFRTQIGLVIQIQEARSFSSPDPTVISEIKVPVDLAVEIFGPELRAWLREQLEGKR